MNEFLNVFLDYIRMVSYAMVILLSLKNIICRRFNKMLFIGDILMAFTLLLMSFQDKFGFSSVVTRDVVLTPSVIVWALIHFIAMIKDDC